jgi:phage tail sheath protein FI
MRRPITIVASSCVALLCLTSCDSGVVAPPSDPEVIVIRPSDMRLIAGRSLQLTISATAGQAGLRAADVAWSTSDTRIAAISKNGTLSAASPGTVRIEAWWKGSRAEATAVVLDAGSRHTTCLSPVLLEHADHGCPSTD